MGQGKDSKFVEKAPKGMPSGQSAGLAPRATPETGKTTFEKENSAFLAKRGEPEKSSVTFKDSRYR